MPQRTVAADMPQELIDLLERINYDKIDPGALDTLVLQLRNFAAKSLPLRSDAPGRSIDSVVPQRILDEMGAIDFPRLNTIRRGFLLTGMNAYLRTRVPMKGTRATKPRRRPSLRK